MASPARPSAECYGPVRLSKAADIEPRQPVQRYGHARPGDMIHLDIKKLGRFERPGHPVAGDRTGQSTPRSRGKPGYGWEYIHIASTIIPG
ncbi:hypothetical protein ACSSVZ_004650 [Amorphus sp. MBR-141]